MRPQRAVAFVLVTIALLLGGCAGGERLAPVSRVDPVATGKPDEHTVRKGDTLYAIAWEYDLDYRDLAAWNGVEHPFVIYPGQVLALRGPPRKADGGAANAEVTIVALPDPSTISGRVVESADGVAAVDSPATTASRDTVAAESVTDGVSGTDSSKANAPAPDVFDGAVPVGEWHWAHEGQGNRLLRKGGREGSYRYREATNNRWWRPRMDGWSTAEPGWSDMGGSSFSSTTRASSVRTRTTPGSSWRRATSCREDSELALMGSSGSDKVKLHFEIRRDGKPVDPLRYLPRRRG